MIFPAAIVIPTWNRARLIGKAMEAALGQSHPDRRVIVVDDGSTDDTDAALAPFTAHPDVCVLRLARNLGTAGAKNVGLMLAGRRAVTFHDSDDLPHRDKVLRQAMVMGQEGVAADPCLNWRLAGQEPGAALRIGAVLHHHELVLPDGRRVEIRRDLSLTDDIFPNLQMGSTVPGDWTHVNSGLFHPQVFARLGGFADCIEEDREFRNRLILGGEVVWVIPELLMTKIETPGSLTTAAATDYVSARRRRDRDMVWRNVEAWRATGVVAPVPVDIPGLEIASASNPAILEIADALATGPTRDALRQSLLREVAA